MRLACKPEWTALTATGAYGWDTRGPLRDQLAQDTPIHPGEDQVLPVCIS